MTTIPGMRATLKIVKKAMETEKPGLVEEMLRKRARAGVERLQARETHFGQAQSEHGQNDEISAYG